MVDKIVYDVDLAKDVKSWIANNRDVTWDDDSLKPMLKNIADDAVLRVGKVIGSLRITSIDLVDDCFLAKIFNGSSDTDGQSAPSE
tara:strand:+ start:126 stop:383 length:258 start_codon:yes stop_codon:yes gene_type:complete